MSSYSSPSTSSHPFECYITPHCLAKLNHYAAQAQPTEIGGLAKLDIRDELVFVMDVAMLPQRANAGFFEINSADIGEFTRQLVKSGRTEEIPQWCSIVHSHPVNMGPSMSGTDIQQIKDFAQESDAFSLIITASKEAKSTRMFMHYCANLNGRKLVIHDMPVKVCHMTEREELAKKLRDVVKRHYKLEEDKDLDPVMDLCKAFCIDTMPGVLPSELDEIVAEAKEMVPQLVQRREQAGSHFSSAWESQRQLAPVSSSNQPPPDVDVQKMTKEDRESWLYYIQLANGFDSRSNSRNVTEKTKIKAQKRLQALATKYGNASTQQRQTHTTPEPPDRGDIVLLKKWALTKNYQQCNDDEDRLFLQSLIDEPAAVSWFDGINVCIEDWLEVFPSELEVVARAGELDDLDDAVLEEMKIGDYLLRRSAKWSSLDEDELERMGLLNGMVI